MIDSCVNLLSAVGYINTLAFVSTFSDKYRDYRERVQSALNDFAQFTVDVIYDRTNGRSADALARFLLGLSLLFQGIVRLRLYCYENRILRNKPLGCLVVVVGNLTVGGTGKTPVVEKFARTLQQRGRRVAILSRGYKSKQEPLLKKLWRKLTHGEEDPPRIVSDGEKVLLDSEIAGDEPFMLASNLPGVAVLCDKNRVKAGSYAIRRFGCDTLILDDGFQYLPLKGRLNLLLVDKTNPFGNQHLLPRGILREPINHLSRADYIFLTKSDGAPDEALTELIREHNTNAEIIECAHTPQYLEPVGGGERLPLDALKAANIVSFSGIAVPESFENMLDARGARILYNKRFLDHHRFTRHEMEAIYRKAAEFEDLQMIVTTEKDAVRLFDDMKPPVPLYFLRLEIEILSGEEDFEQAASRICLPRNNAAHFSRPPIRVVQEE
ncbi:MAG: tetraacyldisaccharide 4'-kinase [Puniceicoccaceae bacterium MED-G30]|jgi:tetraacyldisaccharide 4'-kinase|nr:MAG: tetraacyldisaccharide 4'-kinase [Puniceicoccaceae bacterium MED-G30]RPG85559.1 MAG: tetraacyldisaccharide 4'-kinase [Coraliomargarita sp. TMED73]|tara:strand:- start:3313 stop:4629 length:1317 start_codon:yes stop_codon:yes gene_type:complete